MHDYERTALERSIQTLGNHTDGTLRAAQRLMAHLADIPDQEEAFQFAIEAFIGLTHPQRLALLQTVQMHLDRGQYACLALGPNRLIIEYVLRRLEVELTRKEGFVFKRAVHGPREDISVLSTLIADIGAKIAEVSLPERDLQLSPLLNAFLDTLTDNQFARLILFLTRMRDIKACRDRFHEVVDEDYVAKQLGEQSDGLFGLDLNRDFLQFLRETDRGLVNEMTQMDFQELTILVEALEEMQSRRYSQGQIRRR